MGIEINAPNPDKPDEGIVTSHRVIPGKGIQKALSSHRFIPKLPQGLSCLTICTRHCLLQELQ
jgi:hypothetical protein